MKAVPSILRRVSHSLVASWLVWSIAILGSLWWVVSHEVGEILDDELMESAQILSGLLAFDLDKLRTNGGQALSLPAAKHDERLIWQVLNARNEIVLRSHKAPDTALAPAGLSGFSDAAIAWRVYGLPLTEEDGWTLLVGQEAAERAEVSLELSQYTAATALTLGLVILLWLRLMLRREFAPLREFSEAVRAYDPLAAQACGLPPVEREELEPMRHAIDSLGSRLAQRIASERAFSAHAAHALRTPLAGLDAQLAIALHELPPAARPRIEKARQAATRLQRVVKALLVLFRSGSEPQWQTFLLADLTAALHFEGLAVQVAANDSLHADPDLLMAALTNLIENAAHHQASQVWIEVTHNQDVRADGRTDGHAHCHITLRDNGSGIAPERLAELQQALQRQDYARLSGLGLMLADMVARAHGGRLLLAGDARGCITILEIARPDL